MNLPAVSRVDLPDSHRHVRIVHDVQVLKQKHPVIRSLSKSEPKQVSTRAKTGIHILVVENPM